METNEKDTSFRNRASFGKRMEFSILAEILAEGLDIYTPLVDDNGIDAVIRKEDGSFIEIQIKARSGNEKLFAAIIGSYFAQKGRKILPDVHTPGSFPPKILLQMHQ